MAETDIVERLRHCSEKCGDDYLRELSGRAADEITRLRRDWETARDAHDRRVRELNDHSAEVARQRAEITRLRAALKRIDVGNGWAALIARAALEGRDE